MEEGIIKNMNKINLIEYLPKLSYLSQRNHRVVQSRVLKLWVQFAASFKLTPAEEMFENCVKTVMARLGVKLPKVRKRRKIAKEKKIPIPKEDYPFS